ncbi:hypothetical protein [Streptomyces sp. NPDC059009]|uniref:hypothetical protein n=1 Tax=Streptomyces sp. NPDC059009 TaxID=3346694 RepID=UPI00368932F0
MSDRRLLSHGRRAAMGALAALLIVAGVWASWDTARHVVRAQDADRGTMTVTRCGSDACEGSYAASSGASRRTVKVVIDRSISEKKGARIPVARKSGTSRDVVRADGAGFLSAWIPLGGALLLASIVVAGGLRATRTAWGMALAGGALLTAAFATLTF